MLICLYVVILEDDYNYSHHLKFKTTNESAISFQGETEFGPQSPSATLTISKPGSNFALEKFKVKSDGRVSTELSLTTSAVSKFTISAEDGRQEIGKPIKSFGKIGCQFNFKNFNFDSNIDVVNGPLLTGSFLYNYRNFHVGGEALINSHLEEKDQSPDITDLNVGFGFTGINWAMSTRTTDLLSNLRFSYLQSITSNFKFATILDYRLKSNIQKITFGTEYK